MADKRNGRGGNGSRENECCDFCGARRNDVDLLLTSSDHRLNICNNCIAEAHKMLVAGGIILLQFLILKLLIPLNFFLNIFFFFCFFNKKFAIKFFLIKLIFFFASQKQKRNISRAFIKI